MSVLFIDASALTKRYVMEIGTFWTIDLFDPQLGNIVFISGLTQVEVVSAFKKKLNTGGIDEPRYRTATLQFRYAVENEYRVAEVVQEAIERAMLLIDAYGLRAYDAVQLATAVLLNREQLILGEPIITFISADDKLNAVAAAEGLTVDNPNHHPATTPPEKDLEEGNG